MKWESTHGQSESLAKMHFESWTGIQVSGVPDLRNSATCLLHQCLPFTLSGSEFSLLKNIRKMNLAGSGARFTNRMSPLLLVQEER